MVTRKMKSKLLLSKTDILEALVKIKQEVTHLYILDQFTSEDYQAITRHLNILIRIIRRSGP